MKRYLTAGAVLLALAFGAFAVASAQAKPLPPPPPAFSFDPGTLDFGATAIGRTWSEDLTLSYQGKGSSGAITTSLTGSAFAITTDGCQGKRISARKSCTITVKYAPTAVGTDSGTLSASATGVTGASVNLSGTGFTNTAPTADAHSVTTPKDTVATITLSGSDADGDHLTFAIASGPSNGTLGDIDTFYLCQVGGDGGSCSTTVPYTPNTGTTGVDSFTYTVSDGLATSAPATISIDVGGVPNTPPTAGGQELTVYSGSAFPVNLWGNDVDGDPLTFAIATPPSHGTLGVLSSPNCYSETECGANVSYTPASGYTGADSFSYTVNDGKVNSSAANVSITVKSSLVTMSVITLDFGAAQIGPYPLPLGSKTVTFTNTSLTSTVHLDNSWTTDGYTLEQTSSLSACRSGLAPGASCTATVDFAPPTTGPYNGYLDMYWVDADNSEVADLYTVLKGTGVVKVGQSVSQLVFDQVAVGTTSTLPITFTNHTTTNLNLQGVSQPTGFTANYSTSTCHTTWIAPDGTCTLLVTFAPTAAGIYHGLLRTDWAAEGSDNTVAAVATPVHGATTGLTFSVTATPATLDFGHVAVGTTSDPQVVTFKNDTTMSLHTPSYASPPWVNVNSSCSDLILQPGETCTMSVAFSPTQAASYSSTLDVQWAAPDSSTTLYQTHTQLTGISP